MEKTQPGHAQWLAFVNDRDLSVTQKSAVALIGLLASSPWKFDLLWETWPTLGFNRASFGRLAHEILEGVPADLFGCATLVFDDVTLFADLVGDPDDRRSVSKSGFRAAYLTTRPILCRLNYDAPPGGPLGVTEADYLRRLVFSASTVRKEELPAVVEVFDTAAAWYETRGRDDGAALCRQSAEVFPKVWAWKAGRNGLSSLRGEAVQVMFAPADAAVSGELALQWWPIYRDVAESVSQLNLDPELVSGVQDILSPLRLLGETYERHPGVGSIVLLYVLNQVGRGHPLPAVLEILPREWIYGAQQALADFRDATPEDEATVRRVVNGLQDALVTIGLRSRHAVTLAESGRENISAARKFELTVELRIMELVTQRARQQLNQQEFDTAVRLAFDELHITPFDLNVRLHEVASLNEADSSYKAAMLEAIRILGPLVGNDALAADIELATSLDANRMEREAEAALARGRPDVAIWLLVKSGSVRCERNEHDRALLLFATASELLDGIAIGKHRVPSTAIFDPFAARVALACSWVATLMKVGRVDAAQVIVHGIVNDAATRRAMAGPSESDFPAHDYIQLLSNGAQCADRGGDADQAAMLFACARDIADARGESGASVTTRINLSVIARRRGESAKELRMLTEAQRFAEQHRRLAVVENEKLGAAIESQAAFVWALEGYAAADLPWDAIACLEGLRSRVLLDLLGYSSALPIPAGARAALVDEGRRVMNAARAVILPSGHSGEFIGVALSALWQARLREVDSWLEKVATVDRGYADIVAGKAADASAVRAWLSSVARPTAVVYWALGDEYSFQAAAVGHGDGRTSSVVRRTSLTRSLAGQAARAFEDAATNHRNAPSDLVKEAGHYLFEPIADVLAGVETIYFCPSQALHRVPIPALPFGDQPICSNRSVAIAPSVSVLRALSRIDQANIGNRAACVIGPEFPERAMRVASTLGASLLPSFVSEDARTMRSELGSCGLIHAICHGVIDRQDPWASGFRFGTGGQSDVVTGRTLMSLPLRARLATFESCDTHRPLTTFAEDSFGLARFLHIAGVPSLLLADWEVRSDVSAHFMSTFYDRLEWRNAGPALGRGAAFSAATNAVRRHVGNENFFLWAPFVLTGVAY